MEKTLRHGSSIAALDLSHLSLAHARKLCKLRPPNLSGTPDRLQPARVNGDIAHSISLLFLRLKGASPEGSGGAAAARAAFTIRTITCVTAAALAIRWVISVAPARWRACIAGTFVLLGHA
ncbi:MAG: hypothetical protein AAF619_03235 [Pseudomonadota bacterium]